MSKQDSIQNELKALDSSLPAPAQPPLFSVPDGYFEGFAASVMARIKSTELAAAEEIAQLSPLLAGLPRTMPFTVPDHYFEDNLESLYAVVGDEPVLSLLSPEQKAMPYTLPDGYFDHLGEQIAGKVERPAARVVRMAPRRWMSWAAAAMIAGVVAVSGIFFFRSSPTKQDARLPVTSPQWMAAKLQNISTKDIDEFVRAADATSATSSPSKTVVAQTSDVKKLLHGVSDKDMDAFLSQLPAEDEELAIN